MVLLLLCFGGSTTSNGTTGFVIADSSFVPPLIYALFGSSKHLAVGTVAASSLIIAASIEEVVPASEDPILYTSLVFTSTLISGLVMLALGVFR